MCFGGVASHCTQRGRFQISISFLFYFSSLIFYILSILFFFFCSNLNFKEILFVCVFPHCAFAAQVLSFFILYAYIQLLINAINIVLLWREVLITNAVLWSGRVGQVDFLPNIPLFHYCSALQRFVLSLIQPSCQVMFSSLSLSWYIESPITGTSSGPSEEFRDSPLGWTLLDSSIFRIFPQPGSLLRHKLL